MRKWLLVLTLLAAACQAQTSGGPSPTPGPTPTPLPPPVWAVVPDPTAGSGFAVTDGPHRVALPKIEDLPPDIPPWRLAQAADTDGDGRPEAIVQGYTGGAHCCFVYLVFESRADGIRQVDGFNLGNAGIAQAADLDGDGRAELVGGDDRLAYFDDLPFAASPFLPLILCRPDQGRFRDCTPKFPDRLQAELDRAEAGLKEAVDGAAAGRLDPETARFIQRSQALKVAALAVRLGRPDDGRERVRRLCPECLAWLDEHRAELSGRLGSSVPRPWP